MLRRKTSFFDQTFFLRKVVGKAFRSKKRFVTKRFSLLLLSLVAFLVMFGWNSVENFMALYLSRNFTNAEIALVFISIYFSFSISALFVGVWIERYKQNLAIAAGALLYLPFILIIAIESNPLILVVSGVVLGFGASMFFIGCSTYILRAAEYRGQSMGIFNGMISTGAGLAGLTGGYFLLNHSFSNLFLIGAFVLTIGALLCLLLNQKRDSDVENADVKAGELLSLLKDRNIAKIGVLTFLGLLFFGTSKSFVPLIAKELGGSILDVGIYMFTLVSFALIVAVGGGRLTDKIGRKPGFYVIMILSACCSFLVAFTYTVYVLFLVGVIFSCVNVLTRTISLAAIGDYLGKKNCLAMGSAIVIFYTNLSATFSLLLFGILPAESLKIPFILLGVISIFSLLLVKSLEIR